MVEDATLTGPLIAEEDGYDLIAQGILDAVEAGPTGTWRMPWHALKGGLPQNAFSGRPFRGANFLTLATAARTRGFEAGLWAPRAQWEKKRGTVLPGEEGTVILVPVFDEEAPGREWGAGDLTIEKRMGQFGGDPQGGSERRMLGFRSEPWFNAQQIRGLDIRPPSPPSPSAAAERLGAVLAAWRREEPPVGRGGAGDAGRSTARIRGPMLLWGGHQAYWNPQTDQIMSPPAEAFGDYDGLAGVEFYMATLVHEHVHASGSVRRLRRSSLMQYKSKVGRAKEELVAELGSAFLCARYGLRTALRPDHAHYVASWLSAIADRNQRKAFFWACAAAERAVGYILDQAAMAGAATGGEDLRPAFRAGISERFASPGQGARPTSSAAGERPISEGRLQ